MRPGQSFESEEAAEYYQYRPGYSDELIQRLCGLVEHHNHALDLGCGPGKIAASICRNFESVTAVDASSSMIAAGQRLNHSSNINWINALAEEADFDQPFDLIVPGASIHWMDHPVLFPRLLNHVADQHIFAVVNGDGAFLPPWQEEWDAFLGKWVLELTGQPYEPNNDESAFTKKMQRHREWLDLKGEGYFGHGLTQSVGDFVRCQYSRDTFAPSKLQNRVDEFTADILSIVGAHASSEDMLSYRVRTTLEWGKIRTI